MKLDKWKDSLLTYRHPRVLGMLFLGFSAGLPFLLVFSTLSGWLRDEGVSLAVVGFFGWIGMTYSIKVFWAPVVDHIMLPGFLGRLGRRRGWILLAQMGIAAGLIGLALSNPSEDLRQIIVFALLVAFSSATQDIAVDAYRIEAVETNLQSGMAATYQLGYRLALLVAGGGAFFLADIFSWSVAYLVMAACMAIGIVTVLIVKEPESKRPASSEVSDQPVLQRVLRWFVGAVLMPFRDFFGRYGWMALVILLLIGVYRLSDLAMGVMANPFYLDMGFTKTEIAEIVKVYGLIMTITGAIVGGIAVARFGVAGPLLVGGILIAASNLLFAYLATIGHDLSMLTVTISADNLSTGFAGSVFIAYLSSLTNTEHTATQYALFSSLMTLPGKFLSGFSGIVVEEIGYANFFSLTALLGLPAVMLVLFLMMKTRDRYLSIDK